MLTADEQAELAAIKAQYPSAFPNTQPQGYGIGARIGMQAGNLIPNIAEGLANSGVGILNWGQPSNDQIPRADFWKPFDVPAAQTTGEKVVDVGSGIAQMVGEALIPGGIATKAARAAGMMRAAPLVGDALAGFLQGAKQSPEEAAGTGAEFTALGAANQFIPNPWLKALANVAVPVTGQLLRGRDPTSTDSLISTGANVAVPFLLGKYGREPRSLIPEAAPSDVPAGGSEIVPYVAPERGFTMPGYERPGMVDPRTEPAQWIDPRAIPPEEPLALPGPRSLLPTQRFIPTDYTPPDVAAWEGYDPSADRRPLLMGDVPQGYAPPERQQLLLRAGEQPELGLPASAPTTPAEFPSLLDYAKSRLPASVADQVTSESQVESLRPQWAREKSASESGFIDPSNPVFQYLTGSAAGALAAPVVDKDPNKPLWEKFLEGGVAGAGAVAAGRGIHRLLTDVPPSTAPVVTPQGAAAPAAPPARSLLAKAQDAATGQERGATSPLGWLTRTLEQNFNLGKSTSVVRAEEYGKGTANELRLQAQPVVELLKTATPTERQALLAYEQAPRSAQSQSLLRSAVRPEIADAAFKGEELVTDAQKLIGVHPEDASYRTTKYGAFTEPERWQEQLKVNPNLRQDYVDQLVRDNTLPGFSRSDVEQAVGEYEAEIHRGSDFSSPTASNSKISRDIFMGRKDLTPEHKAFLAEYKDPAQRLAFTMNKLINSAAQAKKIETLADMGRKGELPIMSMQERQAQMATAKAAGDQATVERLASLVRLPVNTSYGKLSGQLVPRDVLDSMNAHNELWTGGWLRNFSGATSFIKGAMTVANPATHARQWIQTPLLAAVARVAPWDFFAAGRAIKGRGLEYAELVRNHIVGADVSSQDLARGATQLDTAFNPGKGEKVKSVLRTIKDAVHGAYGMPDNLVRAAAYLKAKPRFFAEGNAKGLKGVELERYAQDRATDFTNRYTMNYGAVANAVKVGRETPFVSPFVSYQAEMVRLMKNLGEDALKGSATDRVWALGNIGALMAAPLLLEQYGKSQLSDKDLKDWERTNRLSPDYAKGQIRVPISRDAKGIFSYMNIGNLVPAGDSAALARNLAHGDISGVLATNPFVGWDKTPVFKTVAEQVTGRDSITQRQFGGAADRVQSIVKQALPPWVPPGYEGQRILAAFSPNDQGGLGVENARTGRSDTPTSALLGQLGVRSSQVNPQSLLRTAQFNLQEKQQAATSDLKQLLSTNAAPATKEAAKRQTLLKLREARDEYRRLLQ